MRIIGNNRFSKNIKSLKDAEYERKYYLPDFILFDEYVVEIKSWYVEKIQEERQGLFILEKEKLVIRQGYKWLYILDNDFTELRKLVMK